MKTFEINGIEIKWDCAIDVPVEFESMILKQQKVLASIGLIMLEYYTGKEEYMIVGTQDVKKPVKIGARYNREDGSWLEVKKL